MSVQQLNLLTPVATCSVHAVLSQEWQSLDELEAVAGLDASAWPHATRLVRLRIAVHRVVDGVDYYRLNTTSGGRR